MKKHNIWSVTGIIIVFSSALFANAFAALFFSVKLFYIEISLAAVLLIFGIFRAVRFQKDVYNHLQQLISKLKAVDSDVLQSLPMAVLTTRGEKEIVWYNDLFRSEVLVDDDFYGSPLNKLFPKEVMEKLRKDGYASFNYKLRSYTVYKTQSVNKYSDIDVYFFNDDTDLKLKAEEYKNSRPVVAFIVIDNISEIFADAKESEKAVILAEIENILEKWSAMSSGFLCRLDRYKFIMIMEERHLDKYIKTNFDVLEKVRNVSIGERTGATLSVGIGYGGKTFKECEDMAKKALDMAFGRGGDHAVIKNSSNFQFFGGVSKGVERKTKVRTRVIASALKGLMLESDNILIMGHRFGDLDSCGASIGLWRVATELDKPAYIVTNRSKSLAGELLDRLDKAGEGGAIINDTKALSLISKKTLLIIVDTHRQDLLDYPNVYDSCKTVVVIDHHRKTVEHIDNAVIFYHEPYSSSASEMIAEMIQYMGESLIGRPEAEALLAGIMLDTRNFVIRTGVRTFEAAGYLRGRGANPVEVKQLFTSSMPTYKLKNTIISSAEQYRSCAISFVETESEEARVASAQAADELLNISGVQASFVMFPTECIINISARSMGEINVQLIMEMLGGGGHQTMAAAQLENSTLEEARTKLCEVIDSYLNAQKKN